MVQIVGNQPPPCDPLTRQEPDGVVRDLAAGQVEAGEAGEVAADGEHELVRGQVREVEAGQAGQPGQRGDQQLGQLAAAGVLPVLGQAVPQPVADYRFNS